MFSKLSYNSATTYTGTGRSDSKALLCFSVPDNQPGTAAHYMDLPDETNCNPRRNDGQCVSVDAFLWGPY